MLTSLVVTPINHVLRGESWAGKRLQSYTGRTVCVHIPPLFDFKLTVQTNGEFLNTASNTIADTTLSIAPGLLPQLLNHNEAAFRRINISGDDAFAAELIDIGKNLHLNVEQDLDKFIGDIPAHRIAQAGENIIHWHTGSIQNLSQAMVEYWTEEQPMLAKPINYNAFVDSVCLLHTHTEQLEARIQEIINKSL